MSISTKAANVLAQLESITKLGDIKKLAKQIKTDHTLALELWAQGGYFPFLLATLTLDKNKLDQPQIDKMVDDLTSLELKQRNQLTDWLLANQLTKSKKLITLMLSWQHHPSPTLRRLFWYCQARLRWMGNGPTTNSKDLVAALETDLADAEPEAQWAMNFCAAQIGIHEANLRDRVIALGEKLGLYKDEKASKGCTPNYLPECIRIEVAKRR